MVPWTIWLDVHVFLSNHWSWESLIRSLQPGIPLTVRWKKPLEANRQIICNFLRLDPETHKEKRVVNGASLFSIFLFIFVVGETVLSSTITPRLVMCCCPCRSASTWPIVAWVWKTGCCWRRDGWDYIPVFSPKKTLIEMEQKRPSKSRSPNMTPKQNKYCSGSQL